MGMKRDGPVSSRRRSAVPAIFIIEGTIDFIYKKAAEKKQVQH
jgi:hypothetical protein